MCIINITVRTGLIKHLAKDCTIVKCILRPMRLKVKILSFIYTSCVACVIMKYDKKKEKGNSSR